METSLISIIVPVYNIEKYLRKCIDSLINQTYHHIEIILIDDGSTDHSGVICDEYRQKDDRIKIIHQKNLGVSKTRINGFNNSHGDFIVFVDSDDYAEPQYIQKLYECYESTKADLVICQYYNESNGIRKELRRLEIGFYDQEGIEELKKTVLYYDIRTHLTGVFMGPFCKLIKREFAEGFLKAGLGFWYGEDQLGMMYLINNIKSMCIIPDFLYSYVKHDDQVTAKYRPDLWDAYYKLWSKLVEIDPEETTKTQLTYRFWYYSINFLNKSIFHENFISLLKVTRHIFDSPLIRECVFGKDIIYNTLESRKEKWRYNLLKYRYYLTFCIYSYIRNKK